MLFAAESSDVGDEMVPLVDVGEMVVATMFFLVR